MCGRYYIDDDTAGEIEKLVIPAAWFYEWDRNKQKHNEQMSIFRDSGRNTTEM